LLDTYSGATRVIFIVGDPIAQVKSPAGVTEALRRLGHDAVVVPAHVHPADLKAFFDVARRMPNVDGVIVTVPHKFAAAELCEGLTSRARSIGAANVVRRDAQGGWFGDMCDGEGYVAGLRKEGCDPKGKRALLVGAGGAGSAIAHALVDAGVASLALHEADVPRREALAAKLRAYGPVVPTVGSTDASAYDLVINATPAGMKEGDPLPVDTATLQPGTFAGLVTTQPTNVPGCSVAVSTGSGSPSFMPAGVALITRS